jgi:phosphatidylethanolamine/phosphatidyl-N-methylethanolamine N-methyltransferase
VDEKATAQTKARYDRLAPIYDLQEAVLERFAFRHWRKKLWRQVEGERVLEVGVGTGKNAPYYPKGAQVTAVDLSDKMLARARQRMQELSTNADLVLADAQRSAFANAVFDTAVATFVFCSVPDAVVGLGELSRVVKPGGRIVLLEHVRVNVPVIGRLMDLLDPIMVRVMGAHINRTTTDNVKRAGLEIEQVKRLLPGGLVKMIVARAKG